MDKPRILFVDDDQEILAAYGRTLRKSYAVETAAGPEEGLVRAAALEDEAVVVSDLCKPGMDGVEF